MGISDFEGLTFVAFIDICGFKQMMKDEERVKTVVYKFYQSGYRTLKEYKDRTDSKKPQIQGIFVSDCGILYVVREHSETNEDIETKQDSLNQILNVIKKINRDMIINDVMLKTSIAYGKLNCNKKVEFRGIRKSAFYGDAYLNAFLDNEKAQIRLRPGECRIIQKDLPDNLITNNSKRNYENFRLLNQREGYIPYYYFYWMLDNRSRIEEFTSKYKNLEIDIYKKMTKFIKHYSINSNQKFPN